MSSGTWDAVDNQALVSKIYENLAHKSAIDLNKKIETSRYQNAGTVLARTELIKIVRNKDPHFTTEQVLAEMQEQNRSLVVHYDNLPKSAGPILLDATGDYLKEYFNTDGNVTMDDLVSDDDEIPDKPYPTLMSVGWVDENGKFALVLPLDRDIYTDINNFRFNKSKIDTKIRISVKQMQELLNEFNLVHCGQDYPIAISGYFVHSNTQDCHVDNFIFDDRAERLLAKVENGQLERNQAALGALWRNFSFYVKSGYFDNLHMRLNSTGDVEYYHDDINIIEPKLIKQNLTKLDYLGIGENGMFKNDNPFVQKPRLFDRQDYEILKPKPSPLTMDRNTFINDMQKVYSELPTKYGDSVVTDIETKSDNAKLKPLVETKGLHNVEEFFRLGYQHKVLLKNGKLYAFSNKLAKYVIEFKY